MKKILLLFIVSAINAFTLSAQQIYNEDGIRLYHSPSQEEMEWAKSKGIAASPMIPTNPPVGQLRPIAEFEPAEAVLIRYSFGIPMSLIKAMAEYIRVITIVTSSQQSTVQTQYSQNGVNLANCEFLIASSDTYWTRDYGPWFMAMDDNEVAMFDFTYNRPSRVNDNQINSKLAPYLSSPAGGGIPIERYVSTLVLTGGNYMNDGIKQGFSTTLVLQENSLPEPQIKTLYQQYLGIEQQHFIADAIYPYDAIQHIDCWGKLLAPNKVLIDSVAPNAPNHAKFEANAAYFAGLTSSWGMPFEVYRVFAPGATSSSPKTPYSNSLILNNKVFVPIGGNSYDNDALQVYANAMPGYEIIPMSDASMSTKWLNTDALHCRTHEIADRCMLYIKHQPLWGTMDNVGYVNFSAQIYSYCDNAMVSDSVIVYVKGVGDSNFVPHNMVAGNNNTWTATVAGLPNGEVKYYIFAKDESGRRECHPYIGKHDPHKFTLTGSAPDLPILKLDKISSSVTSESFAVVEDQITVSNIGTADLTFEITNIDFPIAFTVTPLDGTLQPNGSQIITLSYNFAGVANGEYTGSFKLLSNDPAHPEIEISLHAVQNVTADIPVLSLDKKESVVSSEGSEIVEDYITASNIGNADLIFEITDIDFNEMLTISPLNETIQADNSQIITLKYNFFDVAKNTEYTGSFKISSNDPMNPEVEISLHATLVVGIDEVKLSTIYVYPNPAHDKINIYCNDEKPSKAYIYNVLGQQLKEINLTKEINSIDVQDLSGGVYFIKIDGHTFKMIKQ